MDWISDRYSRTIEACERFASAMIGDVCRDPGALDRGVEMAVDSVKAIRLLALKVFTGIWLFEVERETLVVIVFSVAEFDRVRVEVFLIVGVDVDPKIRLTADEAKLLIESEDAFKTDVFPLDEEDTFKSLKSSKSTDDDAINRKSFARKLMNRYCYWLCCQLIQIYCEYDCYY